METTVSGCCFFLLFLFFLGGEIFFEQDRLGIGVCWVQEI